MRVLIALDNTYKWLWVPLAEQLIKKKNANVLLVTLMNPYLNILKKIL